MNPIWKKIWLFIKSHTELLEKWRWLILAAIGASLLWVEVREFLVLRILNQAFHYFEVFQYSVLIIATGLLTELFARSNRSHKHAVHILDYKHKLSLELAANYEWESLTQKLAELPGNITGVDETYLLIHDPMSGKLKALEHWTDGKQTDQAEIWDPATRCQKCLQEISNNKPAFHVCGDDHPGSSRYIYSLEIPNKDLPTIVVKFRLKPELKLSREDEDVFNNIGDDIAVAIRTSQNQRKLSELQLAEVAMAERRIVSSYIHDQLGQNLGFMHLKLDQLGTNENINKFKDIRTDLKRLRDVANESYEIVRDILKKLQAETIPHLTNLLREHARTVSKRANLTLNFESVGEPLPLPPNTQQLIFFTFREILSNVENHAVADKLNIVVVWSEDVLDISVADNGKGFDPITIKRDEHFGLDIMQERISNINGMLMIDSSIDSGTVVSITIPLKTIREAIV